MGTNARGRACEPRPPRRVPPRREKSKRCALDMGTRRPERATRGATPLPLAAVNNADKNKRREAQQRRGAQRRQEPSGRTEPKCWAPSARDGKRTSEERITPVAQRASPTGRHLACGHTNR